MVPSSTGSVIETTYSQSLRSCLHVAPRYLSRANRAPCRATISSGFLALVSVIMCLRAERCSVSMEHPASTTPPRVPTSLHAYSLPGRF